MSRWNETNKVLTKHLQPNRRLYGFLIDYKGNLENSLEGISYIFPLCFTVLLKQLQRLYIYIYIVLSSSAASV